jgi:hypothetical protein
MLPLRSTQVGEGEADNDQQTMIHCQRSMGELYVATLDVAGIDEGGTDLAGALDNPARDYTTCTIFRVVEGKSGKAAGWQSGRVAEGGVLMGDCDYDIDCDRDGDRGREQQTANNQLAIVNGPVYEAVDIFVDQGSPHFQEQGPSSSSGQVGRPSLARQLLAFLTQWQVAHVVGDATGVGEGLLNWLAAQLGADVGGRPRVHPFKFTRRSKAQLGVDFVALVETNRFKYWQIEHEFDDAWWFFEQAKQCAYELERGWLMETHLRWFVPASVKVSAPEGRVALHDDRLVSAALVAEVDRLIRDQKIATGRAESIVIRGVDPLEGLEGW